MLGEPARGGLSPAHCRTTNNNAIDDVIDDRMLDAGSRVHGAWLRFGMDGIGRVGDAGLPVAADLIYAEYARTGATSALISRSFLRSDDTDLTAEIARARGALAAWRLRPRSELEAAHAELGRQAALAPTW